MKRLFYNANVITMCQCGHITAFLEEDGIIRRIGCDRELTRYAEGAQTFDLCGKTVLPSFIDAHSHLSSYANSFLQADLTSAASFSDIVDLLRAFAVKTDARPGDWLIASGYDHNALSEKTHPSKHLLDSAFPDNPVILQHKSGHLGVFSQSSLELTGFSGKDSDGYLEETDFIEAVKKAPLPALPRLLSSYKTAQESYASYGITTIQEGMMVAQMLPIYQMLLSAGLLTLDTVGYVQPSDADLFYTSLSGYTGDYRGNFRLGGYKLILDGSPQGKTAWMKTPYEGSADDYGVPYLSDADVLTAMRKAADDGAQLLTHCNGDAACEQFLRCAEVLDIALLRPVMIHAQLLEKAQLPRVKALGAIPSFFVAHCLYWGDTHIENFGFDRASEISPAASASALGIPFTFHQDTPVVPPDMMKTVWCAVNRRTKSGVVLGEAERIPVYDALKAVTVNAALQYGEQARKGCIDEGKYADFVILSDDPLAISPEQLDRVTVLETYKRGKQIYKR